MKRISAIAAVVIGVGIVAVLALVLSSTPPAVSCSVIGETNDVSGQACVVFELVNSHSYTVPIGLQAVEIRSPDGWQAMPKEGQLLTGVPAHGRKSFSYPSPTNAPAWRLQLFYLPQTSTLGDAFREAMARARGSWPGPKTIVTTPVILNQTSPNKAGAGNSAGALSF